MEKNREPDSFTQVRKTVLSFKVFTEWISLGVQWLRLLLTVQGERAWGSIPGRSHAMW